MRTRDKIRILKRARELLEEKGWCQRTMARDSRGCPVWSTHSSAVEFCASGAIKRAADEINHGVMSEFEKDGAFWELLNKNPISAWNDDPRRTKVQVLALFTRRINYFSKRLASRGTR